MMPENKKVLETHTRVHARTHTQKKTRNLLKEPRNQPEQFSKAKKQMIWATKELLIDYKS